MKKFFVLMLLPAMLVFSSCSTSTNPDTHGQEMNHNAETDNQDAHQVSTAEAIQLDNGNKWVVDASTRTHVNNMEMAVNDLSDSATLADMKTYSALASVLKENIKKLTTDCTMTGTAHEELHKWLAPYIDMTKEFSDADSPEQAASHLHSIRESFQEFHKYFE